MYIVNMKTLLLNIEKIERERERLGLTYSALAAQCKMSKQRLSGILKRERAGFDGICLLAEGLDMEPKDLLI